MLTEFLFSSFQLRNQLALGSSFTADDETFQVGMRIETSLHT